MAVGRYPLRLKEVRVEEDDKIASPDQPSQLFAPDDAGVVMDFTVGPPGVGPVIGFDSDDFFTSAPDADIDQKSNRLTQRLSKP